MRNLLTSAALLVVGLSATARADFRLGIGADYWADRGAFYNPRHNWTDGRNQFLIETHIAIDSDVNEFLSLGARAGFFLAVPSITPGIPLDFEMRIAPTRELYMEALVGPWLLVEDAVPIRLHAGIGFGYRGKGFQVGLEVSYLAPSPMVGVRIGFPI